LFGCFITGKNIIPQKIQQFIKGKSIISDRVGNPPKKPLFSKVENSSKIKKGDFL